MCLGSDKGYYRGLRTGFRILLSNTYFMKVNLMSNILNISDKYFFLNILLSKILVTFLLIVPIFENFFSSYPLFAWISFLDDIVLASSLLLFILAVLPVKQLYNLKESAFFSLYFICVCLSGIINEIDLDVFLMQARTYILPFGIVILLKSLKINRLELATLVCNLLFYCLWIIMFGIVWEMVTDKSLIYEVNRYGESFNISSHGRYYSFIGNPVDLGNWAVMCFCIFYSAMKVGFYSKKRVYIALSICLFLLIMSGSRGPLIGLCIVFFVIESLSRGSSFKSLFKLGMLLSALLLLSPVIVSRFMSMSVDYFIDDQYRFLALLKSLTIIADNPLFGVGPGAFGGWVSVNYSYSSVYEMYDMSTKGISSIDMFWPHFVAEIGLFGTLMFFLYWLCVYKKAKNNFRISTNALDQFFSAALCMIIIASSFLAFVNISLETQLMSNFVMVVAGLNLSKASKV